MQVGSPLLAPEGFMSLTKGNVYHLVRNHHQSGRAILALFTHAKRPRG